MTEQWAPPPFAKRAYSQDRPAGDHLCGGAFQPLDGRFSPSCEQTPDIC